MSVKGYLDNDHIEMSIILDLVSTSRFTIFIVFDSRQSVYIKSGNG